MRGKGKTVQVQDDIIRITPAYAGKRKRNPNGMLQSKDHPRLCGEKGFGDDEEIAGIGITPAYAGKSPYVLMKIHSVRDHPRLCGEKTRSTLNSQNWLGSPPPMRGKEATNETIKVGQGITPAYAGKRSSFSMLNRVEQDHPRLCGEKSHPLRRSEKL